MELLGLTGVEDRLQDDVRGTLECMRNAGGMVQKKPFFYSLLFAFTSLLFSFLLYWLFLVGTNYSPCFVVHVWMLTGDKVETARCIAISTKMVGRGQYIHEVAKGAVFLTCLPLPCAD